MVQLGTEIIQTILLAARLLTGHRRRQFQAETTVQFCGGSARQAEKVFGWGRAAVETGLGERRTGIRCEDAFHLRGRKKTEDLCPAIVDHVQRLVDPQAQADPKFQTPFAYTRITAQAVRDALEAEPGLEGAVPTRQTVGCLLNRLGYRLRRVRKARPQKKSPKPTRSSPTSGTPASAPPASPTR